jgi:hypothetical protein
VELGVSEQIDIKGLKAKRFDISCSIKPSKVAEPAAPHK